MGRRDRQRGLIMRVRSGRRSTCCTRRTDLGAAWRTQRRPCSGAIYQHRLGCGHRVSHLARPRPDPVQPVDAGAAAELERGRRRDHAAGIARPPEKASGAIHALRVSPVAPSAIWLEAHRWGRHPLPLLFVLVALVAPEAGSRLESGGLVAWRLDLWVRRCGLRRLTRSVADSLGAPASALSHDPVRDLFYPGARSTLDPGGALRCEPVVPDRARG